MGGHFLIGPQPVCCGNIHSNLIMSSWKKEKKRKKKKKTEEVANLGGIIL